MQLLFPPERVFNLTTEFEDYFFKPMTNYFYLLLRITFEILCTISAITTIIITTAMTINTTRVLKLT